MLIIYQILLLILWFYSAESTVFIDLEARVLPTSGDLSVQQFDFFYMNDLQTSINSPTYITEVENT